jgi:hypothetical protein
MQTFSLTSHKFTGEIILIFDQSQLLHSYSVEAELTEAQKVWFLKHLPHNLSEMHMFIKTHKQFDVVEFVNVVTFEMFWHRYDDKISSSKKRTQTCWNKLKNSDKIKAYMFINRYFANLPHGTRKKYAETYLNAELWNN